PIYLNDSEDNGYDVVRLSPIWTNLKNKKTGKISKVKEAVIMNLEIGSKPDYIEYNKKTDLLLLSRENKNGAFKALDLERGIVGTVNCGFQVYYSIKKTQTNENPFSKTPTYRNEPPSVSIINNTDRTITLFIDQDKHVISSGAQKTISVTAGFHSYVATASG